IVLPPRRPWALSRAADPGLAPSPPYEEPRLGQSRRPTAGPPPLLKTISLGVGSYPKHKCTHRSQHRIFGVPIEVWSQRELRCRNSVNHCMIANYGRIERGTVN